MTKRKPKIYTFICPYAPDCKWKDQGTWKEKMYENYLNHSVEQHYQEPIIIPYTSKKTNVLCPKQNQIQQ